MIPVLVRVAREAAEVVMYVLIAAGVWQLAGFGWALIAAGVGGLFYLTADAWLPLVLTRHGRRHGTDTRARNS